MYSEDSFGNLLEESPLSALLVVPSLGIDETLYSWCATVHFRSGFHNARTTSELLFGRPYAALLHDFPAYVGHLATRTANLLGDARHLALGHTLLGHFLVLLEESEANCIIERVIEGSMPHLKMMIGIAGAGLGGSHWLKFCPQCVKSDRERLGIATWQCAHQYPSSIVCRLHQLPLSIAYHPHTPVHLREWITPTKGATQHISYRVSDAAFVDIERLAHMAISFTSLGPGTLQPKLIAAKVHRRLQDFGLATAGGNVRRRLLASLVRKPFEAVASTLDSPAPCPIRVDFDSILNAIADPSNSSRHPLKQLLTISLLFQTWDDFENAPAPAVVSRSHGAWTVPIQANSPAPRRTEQRRVLVESVRNGKSISGSAKTVGVAANTGVRWARIAGLPYTARPSKLRPGLVAKMERMLRNGKDTSLVAQRLKLSRTTVQRFLSCTPETREAWRQTRASRRRVHARKRLLGLALERPEITITQLRQIAGADYAWLHRNDRSWLGSNFATRLHAERPPPKLGASFQTIEDGTQPDPGSAGYRPAN